jgi:hypothetical protein
MRAGAASRSIVVATVPDGRLSESAYTARMPRGRRPDAHATWRPATIQRRELATVGGQGSVFAGRGTALGGRSTRAICWRSPASPLVLLGQKSEGRIFGHEAKGTLKKGDTQIYRWSRRERDL